MMVIVGSTPAALPGFTPSAMAAIATKGPTTRSRLRVSSMFITYAPSVTFPLVAPRRGMKKARQKFFVMRNAAEIPNLCCEQARPPAAHLGTEPRRRRFLILRRKKTTGASSTVRRPGLSFSRRTAGPGSGPRYCSAGDRVRQDATAAVAETPNQLQAWEHLRCRHCAFAVGARTVFFSCCEAAQRHAVRVPDSSRPGDVDSALDCARKKSTRPGSAAGERRQLLQVWNSISYRHSGFVAVQARIKQCASDHHLGDHQPPTLFRGSGGADHSESADPGLARDLLRVPRQRISRRDGHRLEPGRRGQPAGIEQIG